MKRIILLILSLGSMTSILAQASIPPTEYLTGGTLTRKYSNFSYGFTCEGGLYDTNDCDRYARIGSEDSRFDVSTTSFDLNSSEKTALKRKIKCEITHKVEELFRVNHKTSMFSSTIRYYYAKWQLGAGDFALKAVNHLVDGKGELEVNGLQFKVIYDVLNGESPSGLCD